MKTITFPTDYKSILERINDIQATQYAGTRNFIDGKVTHLSPYISRGVISVKQVADHVLKKHSPRQIRKFLQELAWREYWQSVWQHTGDKIFKDMKHEQSEVLHHKMLTAVDKASTGIDAIDKSIQQFYKTGYMHNHVRMYVSSICCNVGKAHWLQPAKWLYYHLLDGDLASNHLSWQWVAGSFSRKYYCNQENINRYTHSDQQNTFLDLSYEKLVKMDVPDALQSIVDLDLHTTLPKTKKPNIDNDLPILIYNAYNMDPKWHATKKANRILLLEPSHYKKYPVSKKVIEFITGLTENIKDVQVFTGEFNELVKLSPGNEFIFKSHPSFLHYKGTAEQYDAMFPEVDRYYASFSSYWKNCEKYLPKE